MIGGVRLAWLLAAGCLAACSRAGQVAGPSRPGAADPSAPVGGQPAPAVDLPSQDYLVLVASEATDEIALVRFGREGAQVERVTRVGLNPVEPDGPHGLAVSPDGRHYYVSTAHGLPFGWLWKLETATGQVVGRVELDLFPASLQVSPDGHYVYVANFNLHGEMVPSSVSIVATAEMLEVARPETCTMPHGSRFNRAGTRHYSTCMMDEALVEIDATTFAVARHFLLTKGREHGMSGAPARGTATADHSGHGMTTPPAGSATCSPTWAAPSPDGRQVYVACNGSSEIVEVVVEGWRLGRRIPARNGVYNLAVTRDGTRLVATNKRDQSVSIYALPDGHELARIPTQRKVVHGVAISDDDRYAFVSVEGIGSEPGTLEVIDLAAQARVASVDLGQMAGGVDFWRREVRR